MSTAPASVSRSGRLQPALNVSARTVRGRLKPAATCACLFVTAAVLVFGASLAAQELIERVLARVDTAIVMLSDVRAAIGLGLVDGGAGPEGERAALDRVIERQVLLGEVARFPPPEPTDSAIDEAASMMKGRAGARLPALMQTTGIDDRRIRQMARDTLRIQSYIKQRFGVVATLADPDVGQWIKDARGRAKIVLTAP